ncbi:MAG: PEP-CTERM sorting domain-containing protein [bacterium]
MKLTHATAGLFALCAIAAAPATSSAQTWTNWSAATGNTFTGSLLGSSVTFTGNYIGGQLTGVGGTDYFAPSAPYTQGGVTSPDAGGNVGFIQFNQPVVGQFAFSSPLNNVYLALISVGQGGVAVSYTFDQAFTVVSNNNTSCAYWGCGTYSVSGNTIQANEFSGTLLFSGPVSQLSFTTDNAEYWHGATIGAEAPVTAAPEPATLGLMATGLIGMAGFARRRKRNA